jgi:hypothetical protein
VPFRLIWHDSAIARTHPAAPFDEVLRWLTDDGITVDLR